MVRVVKRLSLLIRRIDRFVKEHKTLVLSIVGMVPMLHDILDQLLKLTGHT